MSMSNCDSLKTTTLPPLHRIYVSLYKIEQWYTVMEECRLCFGKHWKSQNKVRRKFESWRYTKPINVWFDVPERNFGSWLAVKHSLEVSVVHN